LFGLQNIVKLKGTLLDCWGRPHPTLEKHVYKAGNSSKNSVHDSIKFFSSCGLSFVKFVKQITNLSIARYSAHFDIKLSSISPIAETFNLDVLTINITMLTIAAQMFIAVWKQNAAEDLLAKKRTIVGT
ncbi:hypothetical protein T06_14854, partial [Trichinella sp. T6]